MSSERFSSEDPFEKMKILAEYYVGIRGDFLKTEQDQVAIRGYFKKLKSELDSRQYFDFSADPQFTKVFDWLGYQFELLEYWNQGKKYCTTEIAKMHHNLNSLLTFLYIDRKHFNEDLTSVAGDEKQLAHFLSSGLNINRFKSPHQLFKQVVSYLHDIWDEPIKKKVLPRLALLKKDYDHYHFGSDEDNFLFQVFTILRHADDLARRFDKKHGGFETKEHITVKNITKPLHDLPFEKTLGPIRFPMNGKTEEQFYADACHWLGEQVQKLEAKQDPLFLHLQIFNHNQFVSRGVFPDKERFTALLSEIERCVSVCKKPPIFTQLQKIVEQCQRAGYLGPVVQEVHFHQRKPAHTVTFHKRQSTQKSPEESKLKNGLPKNKL